MTPTKVAPAAEPARDSAYGWIPLALWDASAAAWLWYALQRFNANTASIWPSVLGPALCTALLSLGLGLHRPVPGRAGSLLLRSALLAAALAGFGCAASQRLGISHGQALWLGCAAAALVWIQRAVYLGTAAGRPGAALEMLRWVLVGLAGTMAVRPFYHSGELGSGDAHWYTLMLGDYVTQLRAGVFPVWVGQSLFAFNGAVSPLRLAPGILYFGGVVDLFTAQSLDMVTLRNACLALTSILGAYSAYACLRPILKGAPWIACALSVLWVFGPGVLTPAMVSDQYMTFMTQPYAPLLLHGLWRAWQKDDLWARVWVASGLAALWLFHSPIAIWFTFIAVGVYGAALVTFRPIRRQFKLAALTAGLFLLLGSVPFVSVLTLDNQLKSLGSTAGAAATIHATFPGNFRPIDPSLPGLETYQLGYALVGALLVSLALMVVDRPRGAWAFAAACLALVPFTIPFPWLTDALWLHVPTWFIVIQNVWPLQRLFLVWSALILFLSAIVMGSPRVCGRRGTRLALCAAFLCGVVWSVTEAQKIHRGIIPRRLSAEQARVLEAEDNVALTRYAYASFAEVPEYFSHAYMEPWLENRLLDLHTLAPLSTNADAAAPGPGMPLSSAERLVQSGTWTGHSITGSRFYRMSPALSLEPGKHYALRLDFLQPGIGGTLQIQEKSIFREYTLPDSGIGAGPRPNPLGFGSEPGAGHVIALTVAGSGKVTPDTLFIANSRTGEALPFARFWLYAYDRDRLPVAVESWIPYRARVTTARSAFLETPRMWLKGWRAWVNGHPAATMRSPENLVMVPVGPGTSRVELRYRPPAVLSASFWLAASGWAGLACLGLCQLALWSGGARLHLGTAPRSGGGLAAARDAAAQALVLARRYRTQLGAVAGVLALAAAGHALLGRLQGSGPAAAGPVQVRFTRPRGHLGSTLPLLSTGHEGEGTVVSLTLLDGHRVRLDADVGGSLYLSDPIEMGYAQGQSVVVSDSALYPPGDPKVKALLPSEAAQLRGNLSVELNGKTVIQTPTYAYETTASELLVGESRFGNQEGKKFPGEIGGPERLAIPRRMVLASGRYARLRMRLPAGAAEQPVVSVVAGAEARLCSVTPLGAGRLRISVWGQAGSPVASAEAACDPAAIHELVITPGVAAKGPRVLAVACSFDGAHVLGEVGGPCDLPPVLTSGLNVAGATGVQDRFTGPQLDLVTLADQARAGVVEATGPEHMVITLPPRRVGRHEPLLTTGRTNAGDMIFVAYEDDSHVRIGYDHWGYGGPVSDSIPIDYGVPHELWISAGSLFPPAGDEAAWRGVDPALRQRLLTHVSVVLDGTKVLSVTTTAYPSLQTEVAVARNPIGGSTCDASFMGTVDFSEREGPRAPPLFER